MNEDKRAALKAAFETAAAQNFAGRKSESKGKLIAEFRDQIAVLRAKQPRPSWEAIAALMRPALDASPDTWRKAYDEPKRKRSGRGTGKPNGKTRTISRTTIGKQTGTESETHPVVPPPSAPAAQTTKLAEHAAIRNAGRKT